MQVPFHSEGPGRVPWGTPGVLMSEVLPGGNITVGRISGDVIDLRQDPRDTKRWWFCWNFRVRGAERRSLRFRFTKGNVIGRRGPAVSLDEGPTWSWLGIKSSHSWTRTVSKMATRARAAHPGTIAGITRERASSEARLGPVDDCGDDCGGRLREAHLPRNP